MTVLQLIAEAVQGGARQERACEELGLTCRTVQRWREDDAGDDGRAGPRRRAGNALSDAERERVLEVVNSQRFRNQSPKQIVPELADRGLYLASESTMYRILRAEDQLAHRGRAAAPTHRAPDEHTATGANQVWSWDISAP